MTVNKKGRSKEYGQQKRKDKKRTPPLSLNSTGFPEIDGTILEVTGFSKFARGLPEIFRIWAEYSGSGLDLNQISRFSCFCLNYISGFLNFWISVSRFLDFCCCDAAAAVLCLRGCCSCCCCCC